VFIFEGITIGDTLTCRVLAVTGKGSVHFTLPETELKTKGGGGSSPVTAVAKRKQLEKSSQEDEKIGRKRLCAFTHEFSCCKLLASLGRGKVRRGIYPLLCFQRTFIGLARIICVAFSITV
jgi:hypothetical protein